MNMKSVGPFLEVIGMRCWEGQCRGTFEWVNDWMHDVLDAEVLPGEQQGVHAMVNCSE